MNEEKNTKCGCHDHEQESCGCGEHEHDHCGCGDDNCDCHDHEDCGCGCGDHEALVVELEDENGNVIPCEIVDGFSYKDTEYALVQNPEDGSTYLFKVVGDEEVGELVIPEDEEFEAATAYYEQMLKEEQ